MNNKIVLKYDKISNTITTMLIVENTGGRYDTSESNRLRTVGNEDGMGCRGRAEPDGDHAEGERQIPQRLEAPDGIHVLSPAREERISEAFPPGTSVLLPDPGTAGGVQRPADE